MTEREFEALVGQMVKQHLPHEVVAFELGASEIIADLYAGRPTQPAKRPEFGFGYDDVKAFLEFVALLKGAFETVKLVSDWVKKRELERQDTVTRFAGLLAAQGIPEAKAREIAKQHAPELEAAVKGTTSSGSPGRSGSPGSPGSSGAP